MCGLAGFVDPAGVLSRRELEAMARTMVYRGPNDEGYFFDGHIGLGHRRLSVLDTSRAGRQPMTTRDGRYSLIFNGEVYNFRELREDLEKLGDTFSTGTDSEVVLACMARWGRDAIPMFNGMFAFAFSDHEKRDVLLVRDRFGVKPLYWTRDQGRVLFASEIKAILAVRRRSTEIDPDGLLQYLHFQNLLGGRTIFEGIEIVEPGWTLQVSGQGQVTHDKWWNGGFASSAPDLCSQSGPAQLPHDPDELDAQFVSLFRNAVQSQLVSDVPLGAYLSGGMDSGAIVAVASQARPGPLATFTLGFNQTGLSLSDQGRDERARARLVANTFGTEHHEGLIRSGDVVRTLDTIVYHLEEPRVGQCYPNFLAAQLASENVTVCLSGAGGDELFGGYPWRYEPALAATDCDSFVKSYFQMWCRLVPVGEANGLLRKEVRQRVTIDVFEDFRSRFKTQHIDWSDRDARLRASLDFELESFLRGLLVVDDKLAMAHSLETRVPFLDNDVADFAMQLPTRVLLGLDEPQVTGSSAITVGKPIVRSAMGHLLPAEITEAAKQGFSGPDQTWFLRELRSWVASELLEPNAPIYEYLDRETVRRTLDDHFRGKANRRLFIWSALYLNSLIRVFLLNDGNEDRVVL